MLGRVMGYSDSDWGDAESRTSQSSGKIFADGVPLNSFLRRQSVIAISSGTAEFHGAAAVLEPLMRIK